MASSREKDAAKRLMSQIENKFFAIHHLVCVCVCVCVTHLYDMFSALVLRSPSPETYDKSKLGGLTIFACLRFLSFGLPSNCVRRARTFSPSLLSLSHSLFNSTSIAAPCSRVLCSSCEWKRKKCQKANQPLVDLRVMYTSDGLI